MQGTAVAGDQVTRCIVKLQAAKGVKAYDKAEDPIYALEHNLPIDFQHYLDHHLELPLQRLFSPMMANPKELMCGECPCTPALSQTPTIVTSPTYLAVASMDV